MIAGRPAASSCARSNSSRTPCMLTRAKVSVTVVKRADDVEVAGAAHLVQRPGAVLAARPGDQRLRARLPSIVLTPPAAARTFARAARRSCPRPAPSARPSGATPLPPRARRIPRRRRPCPTASRAPPRRRTRCRPPSGSISTLRASALAGRGGRHGAEHPGLVVPARGVAALDRALDVGAEQRRQPVAREVDHRGLALARPARGRNLPPTSTSAERRARHIGEQRGGARAGRLLEHQVVALQAERIARQSSAM